MGERRSLPLSPFGGLRSQRVADRNLGGTYMRGGYNVALRDAEWWTRQGEELLLPRCGQTPWHFIFDATDTKTVICNAFYALRLDDDEVSGLYDPAATEIVDLQNGSTRAITNTTRDVDQLMLVGTQPTAEVYRLVAVNVTEATLDRPYEGTTGSKTCRFYEVLARDTGGTAVPYALTTVAGPSNASAMVFEQLITHAAGAVHAVGAGSPAVTAGFSYLIITSSFGTPVAITLTSSTPVRRDWFYNTSLSTAAIISSSTMPGFFAEVYKGRLFIAGAPDSNGRYGRKTLWYSRPGDFLYWHSGIQGQTALGNWKTFDGERNIITGLRVLGEALVVHRVTSQEICSITQSATQPFNFRTNAQQNGTSLSNRIVLADGLHYIWTKQGPAVFDGSKVTLIASEALRSLDALRGIRSIRPVSVALHDEVNGHIYWQLPASLTNGRPAEATVLTPLGLSQITPLVFWVYSYRTGDSWLEYRAPVYGGGMATTTNTVGGGDFPELHASRLDGTIIKLTGGETGFDIDLEHPEESTSVVQCEVDTPWLDFGSIERKKLTRVEVTCRGLEGNTLTYDETQDLGPTGIYVLRLQVYGDMSMAATIDDRDAPFNWEDVTALGLGEDRQYPSFVLEFTPNCSARTFKLRFTNELSDEAAQLGYNQTPFRISDVVCFYDQDEGDTMRTYMNAEVG